MALSLELNCCEKPLNVATHILREDDRKTVSVLPATVTLA
jgi:hypothetical protein